MALTMKDRFARLNLSKLPESYKSEFEEMKSGTYDFSDEELNDIFRDNFNDMYDLVEKKYPDAIKTGETIKKVKPGKVKVVKPKPVRPGMPSGIELMPEHPIHKGEKKDEGFEAPVSMRKKLSEEDIIFIESELVNDEASTSHEMVAHFVKETGMTEAQAKKWVGLRDKYLRLSVEQNIDYPTRTGLKKAARKGTDIVKTMDGKEIDRKSSKNVGKTFYDVNGKAWKCKEYNAKLDDCILQDADGKLMSSCIKEMYTTNPVQKREKGNMVDECKDTLKEAGYKVHEHKEGKKKIRRSEPRPEKAIIKERVEETFVPIMKDLVNSEEKKSENKELISVLESIQGLFTKFMGRVSNLADDGKIEKLKKIEQLLKEIID